MSCWVVPAIAAEMWGVSVAQVLARIAEGSLATRQDGGWTFVDIAPDSPTFVADRSNSAPRIKPPTYTIITREEEAALAAEEDEIDAVVAQIDADANGGESDDDAEFTDEQTPDISWRNWHSVRAEVGRTRCRPPMALAA